MSFLHPMFFKIVLLSFISLFYSLHVSAYDKKENKNLTFILSKKVEIVQTDDLTKDLNVEVSECKIVKSKLNHKFIEGVAPWSALNNNVVCSLVFEIDIPNIDISKKQIAKPFCKTSAALLKLNNQSIVDIKNHKLYYYQNREWIRCNELSNLIINDKIVKAKIQIPILNYELQKLIKLNTSSIDKVRILFDDDENYIDCLINAESRGYLFKKLNELANIDNNEMQIKSIIAKQRRGF
jgi:hypothetical protein